MTRHSSTNWTGKQSRKQTGEIPTSEGKQAEFLVEECFPWELIELIGVINAEVAQRVVNIINKAGHQPDVAVKPAWYY
jgi:hypothetical protein